MSKDDRNVVLDMTGREIELAGSLGFMIGDIMRDMPMYTFTNKKIRNILLFMDL